MMLQRRYKKENKIKGISIIVERQGNGNIRYNKILKFNTLFDFNQWLVYNDISNSSSSKLKLK